MEPGAVQPIEDGGRNPRPTRSGEKCLFESSTTSHTRATSASARASTAELTRRPIHPAPFSPSESDRQNKDSAPLISSRKSSYGSPFRRKLVTDQQDIIQDASDSDTVLSPPVQAMSQAMVGQPHLCLDPFQRPELGVVSITPGCSSFVHVQRITTPPCGAGNGHPLQVIECVQAEALYGLFRRDERAALDARVAPAGTGSPECQILMTQS